MMDFQQFRFPSDRSKSLADFSTVYKDGNNDDKHFKKILKEHKDELARQQEKLYAFDKYSLLIIFQAMDAAGKDGTIKHVMSGVNPQGCHVKSFKKPSEEELDHTYLWRCIKAMPERGQIGIFNRSYYEEVLVVRVHPKLVVNQKLPRVSAEEDVTEEFWNSRYREINNLEAYFVNNGVEVLKFFLYVSREEQKKRFLKRIDDPAKNWKISLGDFQERQHWDKYMEAYGQMLLNTSTSHAPWHVIPADDKPVMRAIVEMVIIDKLKSLNLRFPEVGDAKKEEIDKAGKWLRKKGN